MANFNIKETRKKTSEAGGQIEAMSAQMDTLKQKKDQLLDARTELEGADGIDEESKELMREGLSSLIEQTQNDAETLSDKIGEKTAILENSMQEVQEAEAETAGVKSSIEKKTAFLERLGIHGVFDGIQEKLESDRQGLEAAEAEIIEARKMGEDAQRIASTIKN